MIDLTTDILGSKDKQEHLQSVVVIVMKVSYMLSREAILSHKSPLSLFSDFLYLLQKFIYLEARNVHTMLCGTISHNATMIQNPGLLSVPLLVILDIQVTFTVVLLSIENICFIYLWFSNVGRFFYC